MKRAFTLIELLVVIAIIAILAAILFPVFAQAKEAAKKTTAISQYKQTATGVVLYTGDTDDTLPSQASIGDGGPCGLPAGQVQDPWVWYATIPAGADDVNCTLTDGQAWVNSTQPYIKSFQMLESQGFDKRDAYTAAYMATIRNPASSSLTMNGLLHHFNASAVAQPSSVPLIWPGSFKNNFRGGTPVSSPVLDCRTTATNPGGCSFNASGINTTGQTTRLQPYSFYRYTDPNLSKIWHYGRGMVFTFTDTSAKFVQVNPGAAATAGSINQPFINFTNGGQSWGGQHTICATVPNVVYPSFFRPDKNGAYGTQWVVSNCQW